MQKVWDILNIQFFFSLLIQVENKQNCINDIDHEKKLQEKP